MGDLANLILEQTSKLKSINEVCSNFITTSNEDIIKAISYKQYNLLKCMGELLEKKLLTLLNQAKQRRITRVASCSLGSEHPKSYRYATLVKKTLAFIFQHQKKPNSQSRLKWMLRLK